MFFTNKMRPEAAFQRIKSVEVLDVVSGRMRHFNVQKNPHYALSQKGAPWQTSRLFP
jgi:hypothetical protein